MISKNLPRVVIEDRITIFGKYTYYTPAMLIKEVKEAEATIPVEYRDTIYFYVEERNEDPYSDTSYPYPYLMMKFQRLETDQECEARLKKEEVRQAEIQRREREEYERLAKKLARQ